VTPDGFALRDALTDEIIRAFGLPKTAGLHRIFSKLLLRFIDPFSLGGMTFDRMVAQEGFRKAALWLLTMFCSNITVHGLENIPLKGPLLLVSNHPGTIDVLLIMAMLIRKDVKHISNDIPFLKCLPGTSSYLIYGARTKDIYKRMSAVRAGIRHLQSGGLLFLMGSGIIDPDPEVYADAGEYLDLWSPSIDLFLRKVPETKVLVTIVSGVLSPSWGHHPITWLRRAGRRKRLLAELGQVAQQLLFPGSLYLASHISFAPPIDASELQPESGSRQILPALIARAKILLAQHLERISIARVANPK
jgi:hypothetical protein